MGKLKGSRLPHAEPQNIAVGIWLHDKLLLLLSKIKGRFSNTGTEAKEGLFAGLLGNPKFCYIFRE